MMIHLSICSGTTKRSCFTHLITSRSRPCVRYATSFNNCWSRSHHDGRCPTSAVQPSRRRQPSWTDKTEWSRFMTAGRPWSNKSPLYFSTTTNPTTPMDDTATTTTTTTNSPIIDMTPVRPREEDEVLLYERDMMHPDAMRTTTFMKSGFVFSTFHTLYWIWYTVDFIPHVNKAAMEVLHVDPMLGITGIAIALALQSAFVIYPLRLISKLVYRIDEKRICIYTHRIPSMYPGRRLYTSFPLGTPNTTHNAAVVQKQQLMKATSKEDIQALNEKAKAVAAEAAKLNLKYFKLDATTPNALTLIEGESQGDLSKYRGSLVLGNRWPKYILDVKDSQEVKESALLLQALLKPEHFYYKGTKHNFNSNNHKEANSSSISQPRSTKRTTSAPFQHGAKSRPRNVPPKPKKRR